MFKRFKKEQADITVTGKQREDGLTTVKVTYNDELTNKHFIQVMSDLVLKALLHMILLYKLNPDTVMDNLKKDVIRTYQVITDEGEQNNAQ